jgi:hypothetical protein
MKKNKSAHIASPIKNIPGLTRPLQRRISSSSSPHSSSSKPSILLLPPPHLLHQHNRGRRSRRGPGEALYPIAMTPVDGVQLPRVQRVEAVFGEVTRD